jgi:hypothetical protein
MADNGDACPIRDNGGGNGDGGDVEFRGVATVTSQRFAALWPDVKSSTFISSAVAGTITAFTWFIAGGDSGGHTAQTANPVGGSGTGFQVSIAVDGGGFVTTITLMSGGTGYAISNTPSFLFTDGTGDTITFTVTAII